MENSMMFHSKLKIEPPYDSVISLLGIYSKELKSGSLRGVCTLMIIAALFPVVKGESTLTVHQQINGWRRFDRYIDIDINIADYYSAIKRMKSCHFQQPRQHFAK